jgi:hypothetical protein
VESGLVTEWDAAADVYITTTPEAVGKEDEHYHLLPERQASPAGSLPIVPLGISSTAQAQNVNKHQNLDQIL